MSLYGSSSGTEIKSLKQNIKSEFCSWEKRISTDRSMNENPNAYIDTNDPMRRENSTKVIHQVSQREISQQEIVNGVAPVICEIFIQCLSTYICVDVNINL